MMRGIKLICSWLRIVSQVLVVTFLLWWAGRFDHCVLLKGM